MSRKPTTAMLRRDALRTVESAILAQTNGSPEAVLWAAVTMTALQDAAILHLIDDTNKSGRYIIAKSHIESGQLKSIAYLLGVDPDWYCELLKKALKEIVSMLEHARMRTEMNNGQDKT